MLRFFTVCSVVVRVAVAGLAWLALNGVPGAFAHPSRSLVVTATGDAIVPDAGRSKVWRVSPRGKVSVFLDDFHCHWLTPMPGGADILAEHLRYEPGTNRFFQSLHRLSPGGQTLTVVPAPAEGGEFAMSFAVSPSGDLLFYPGGERKGLWRRNREGAETLLASPGDHARDERNRGEPPFAQVTAMAFGPKDELFVVDGSSVRAVSSEGAVRMVLSALPRPAEPRSGAADGGRIWGLCVTERGEVLLAGDGRIMRVDRASAETLFTSDAPWFPTGVAARDGRIYILEHGLEGERNLGPRIRVGPAGGPWPVLGTVAE